MNTEIKIGDHVKAEIVALVPFYVYGIVTEINHDEFIELHLHDNDCFPAQRIWRYNPNECTRITPQEYFKQILLGN